ncbi:hypothetical protein ACFX12_028601 [Malus domestica]
MDVLLSCRWNGESLQESIKRHEHFLALQLGFKPGQKVLDVRCGIGGPLREMSRFRFSVVSITGLNNEYQITRGKELNSIVGVDKTCNFVKADFMNYLSLIIHLMRYMQLKRPAMHQMHMGATRRFTEY